MLSVNRFLHFFLKRRLPLLGQTRWPRADIKHNWNRDSVANGVLIGLFCAMLPLPIQSIIAAIVAIAMNAHLPLAIALVWVSNPLTAIPLITAALYVGCVIMGVDLSLIALIPEQGVMAAFKTYWAPFLVGSLTVGAAMSLGGYLFAKILWVRLRMDRWLTPLIKLFSFRSFRSRRAAS
jgi:uncharacterized protein (DUF2062 family)